MILKKCEKENSSDSCKEDESKSAYSSSENEDTENNSHLSKEDRKLPRKIYVVLV